MAKKVLKDINKDGKRNFKDTWLGDFLGADGKLGVEKGNPRLGASMKGARREVPGEASSKSAKPKARPAATETKPAPKESVGRTSMPVPKAKPEPRESVGRTSMKVPKGITYEQWKGMTRTERRDAGLPVSVIGGELAFNRFLSGITGKDYKVGGEAEVKKPKLTTRIDWGTYSKGGMTTGKK